MDTANSIICPWGRRNTNFTEFDMTPDDKVYIGTMLLDPSTNVSEFCRNNGIVRKTAYRLAKRVREGRSMEYGMGRPLMVDAPGFMKLCQHASDCRNAGEACSRENMVILLKEIAEESAARRGQVITTNTDNRTIDRYLNNSELKTKNAQKKTEPRSVAENDPLTAMSTYSMWRFAFVYVDNAALVINFDATQFAVGDKVDDLPQVVICVKNEADPDVNGRPVSSTANNAKDNMYFIKYFCVVSLAGFLCPQPVFVLADARLGPEEFYVYKVIGLSCGSSDDDFGWVCFAQTRCPGEHFFRWFFEHVLAVWIAKLQKKFFAGSAKGNKNVFVTCDGEADQIYPFLKEQIPASNPCAAIDDEPVAVNSCRALFDSMDVMLGKLAASSTAVAQALDAYKAFCTAKKACKSVRPFAMAAMQLLRGNLDDMFKAHALATSTKDTPFNASDRPRAISGLVKIIVALTKSLTQNLIRSSFLQIGIKDDCTVNPIQILKQFNIRPTPAILKNVTDPETIEKCNALFRQHGRMTDAELAATFEVAGKSYDPSAMPRDAYAISRERCVILTSPETLDRFNKKIQNKEDARLAIIAAEADRVAKREAKAIEAVQKAAETEIKRAARIAAAAQKVAEAQQRREAREATAEAKRMQQLTKGSPLTKKRKQTYCFCKVAHDSPDAFATPMVQCCREDKCSGSEWYHFACIRMQPNWEPEDNWCCFSCGVPV